MPQTPVLDLSESDADLKRFSCFTCRQRKVKCDRHKPCSNCIKAEKQCSFVPPVRGKRKRTKPPKEGIYAKLKRYEELLKSYGAQIEPSEYGNDFDSSSVTASQPDVEMVESARPQSKDQSDPYGLKDTKPMFITKDGASRYLDSALWSRLGFEFQHPEVDSLDSPMEVPNPQESDSFFTSAEQNSLLLENSSKIENLRSLHPSFQILAKLQEVYVDRVDPLMKILHLPTFWASLMDALQNPKNMSKSLEALIFSFYLATISALEESDCLNILGVPKSSLYTRYRLAARQALINAEFLSTSNLMTLRAFAMFMMGVRNSYRCDTLFIFSGVTIRLARKMGLHRDGSFLGLSPFESEMRRRLWWHLVQMDFRMADMMNSRPSMDLCSCDTKMPLNVFDEDLSPEMINSPPERNGITPIVICLIRCEIIEFLRRVSSPSSSDVRWELLDSSNCTTARKDGLISQVEDLLERKYLRYCEPSNSLHNLTSIMVRSSICKMRLFAFNPRRYADSSIKVPQSERDIVFANASKFLEYATLIPGNPSLEKYMWQATPSYLWNPVLYVLIDARHRKIGPEVERTWQLIGVVMSKFPRTFERSTGAVYTALRKWTLEIWDDYIAAMRIAGFPEPSTPEYIHEMRRRLRLPAEAVVKSKVQTDLGHSDPTSQGNFLADVETFESYDFSDILSFEMSQNEWLQWEHIVAEEGGFSQLHTT